MTNPLHHHTFAPWHADGSRRIVADESEWAKWIEIDRQAKASGQRQRVMVTCDIFDRWPGSFVDSNDDCLFVDGHEWFAPGDDYISMSPHVTQPDVVIRLISVVLDTKNLDWLIVTECPEIEWFTANYLDISSIKSVWLGCLIRTQAEADERIPHLLSVPAAVRFALCEPREHLNFEVLRTGDFDSLDALTGERSYAGRGYSSGHSVQEFERGLDLLVCRGETGTDARPLHWRHARSLRDQCESADVPFFFEGWGEWASGVKAPLDIDKGATSYKPGAYHDFGDDSMALKVGSAHSGRLLDGKTHDGLPEVAR
jgi:protein gp37